MTEPLFGPPETSDEVIVDRGRDARTTARQKALLEAGIHPATRKRIHPDAPKVAAPGEPGGGPRCGDCAHLTHKVRSKTWLKCWETPHAYDMRAWWPACHLYKPKEAT